MDDYDFIDAVADIVDGSVDLNLKGCAIVLLVVLFAVGVYFLLRA